ncbi:ribosome biogenesis GTPase Der [Candidatus Dependentiae bacterium]|nr:ribosome biogenesis GTPase Der [Candidatus Dependentiae bacterium]
MSRYPTVVVIGRTNVGKSTLFNRLSPKVKSIAFDQPGVTRDSLADLVNWKEFTFELVDTGGVSIRVSQDPIFEQVRLKALDQLKKAQVVLFVCDGTVGILQEDREIAKLLHKNGVPVVVAVNKIDTRLAQERLYEFESFGMDMVVPISAQHGTGVIELLDALVAHMAQKPAPVEDEDRPCRVVLLGKPNVGKSSLMNHLVKFERSIVSPEPGTTRESISETIQFYKADIQLTDTAGIRRKRTVSDPLETLMVKSSFRAVENADVILLLIDAASGTLADQELKLAFYILEKFKALIILFNKQDLVAGFAKEDMERKLDEYKHLMKKIPVLSISCKTGKDIGRIMPLVHEVYERYKQRFDDDELSMLIKEALQRKPLYHNGNMLIVRRVKQVAIAPTTFLIIANQPSWFGPTQLGYFENILRKKYDFAGVPIRFFVRKKG